jgi:hypothetical protein
MAELLKEHDGLHLELRIPNDVPWQQSQPWSNPPLSVWLIPDKQAELQMEEQLLLGLATDSD